MQKSIFTIILFAVFIITDVYGQEKDHPIISIGFTELLQTENLLDDYAVDLRLFKNLDHGFAVGGKIASDFDEMFEAGASVRKTLWKTLYAYGDGGY
jgi:hypothetical protein